MSFGGPAGTSSPAAYQSAQSPSVEPSAAQPADHYILTAVERARAVAYSRRQYFAYFAGIALTAAICVLLWRARVAKLFRDWSRRFSTKLFLQCLTFVPLLLSALALLQLPLQYYSGFVVERAFGLSTENPASWLADWAKALLLNVTAGVPVVWLLYTLIRRSPRGWWIYFWLATIPIALAVMLIHPLVIDPLFFKFTPLDESRPELVSRIESMAVRAGLGIPRSRIFLMNASSKTRVINAYVTGLGASKRIVIWDTALEKLGPDETLLMTGHEVGHYVLDHIPKEFALIELVALGMTYLGFLAAGAVVGKAGPKTGIESTGDLASLPVLLLVLTFLLFLASPIICGISRHFEHQADQFGLELAEGVVADPNAAEVRSLEALGREDLEDPDPSPFIKFWLYTHPPIEERIQFAAHYKPWAEGKPLELLKSSR